MAGEPSLQQEKGGRLAMRAERIELAGGAAMDVEVAGEGPALLLLHAGVSERHMWDHQWEWLQHGFTVVRWDWRGFGTTPHVPGPFSYADDVIRVMEALNIAQATLMGCSFGGSVAIQTGVQHPERVERLVLVGSGVPGYEFTNSPEVEALFSEAEAALGREDRAAFLDLMERIWLVGPNRTADQVDAQYLKRARELLARAYLPENGAVSQDAEWSAQGRLSEIQVPVLVIVGDQDVPDILDGARVLDEALPNVSLEVLEDAAHLPNLERPRQFDAILSEWLAETGNGSKGSLD